MYSMLIRSQMDTAVRCVWSTHNNVCQRSYKLHFWTVRYIIWRSHASWKRTVLAIIYCIIPSTLYLTGTHSTGVLISP